MSDEHRADVSGYEGNTVVRTPVLDGLAKRGVAFRNAYTASPICIPTRMCMMSGQLPKTCGCEVYGQDLEPGYMTFARLFAQHAYTTVACGKLAHVGTDQMQGWTRRIGNEMAVSPKYLEGRVDEAFAQYPPKQLKWSDAKEIRRAGVGRPGTAVADAYTVQGAINFINSHFADPYYDRARPDVPVLLKVSLVQPHYPYMTSEERFNYYLNRVQPFLDQTVSDHPALSTHQVVPGVDVTERELQRAVAAYYGMIETVDEHFGQVIDALARVGQNLDDWIIIYTSDHGEMLGDHGVWEKEKFYEGSVRVPLIISWPSHLPAGRIVQENVNLCDLFATLCDLANLPVPDGLDSRSLVPLLQGTADDWDNETISQFRGTQLMVKRDHLKYQYYGPAMPEVLFDLEQDPSETVNYIDDPGYEEAVQTFRKRRDELGFGPDGGTSYVNAGY